MPAAKSSLPDRGRREQTLNSQSQSEAAHYSEDPEGEENGSRATTAQSCSTLQDSTFSLILLREMVMKEEKLTLLIGLNDQLSLSERNLRFSNVLRILQMPFKTVGEVCEEPFHDSRGFP